MKGMKLGISMVAAVVLGGIALSGEKSEPQRWPDAVSAPAPGAPAKGVDAKGDLGLPVIGYLEKQDRTITIRSGPSGQV